MTFTIRSRAAATGLSVAGAVFVLAIAACGENPGLRATKPDCERACAHAVGLNEGGADALTQKCPALCIEQEWTVGEVRCLIDATTYEGVRRCAVVVKVADDKKREIQLAEQSAKIERLLAALKSAEDEAQRAALQKQLEEAHAVQKALRGVRGAGTPRKGCTCEPGDTLCSML